ncbi:hypothetical protein [Curtobacterium sp. MCBD17_040]|uniref:hypothetical protein n=1 Tax=Curtobacterium sp. MCBD17_040 TaxID=2175674 RepID=UPI000DAA1F9F|nr:hypothetical protein [Curtobacterium sp. MCBD17_040]WIB65346.1 hypothetical protein DEI94_18235 [Curtobacterium sp. MCBD17_040]
MSLLLPAGPAVIASPLDSFLARVAALTDAEVSALAAVQDQVDVLDRYWALVAVAAVDSIDVEWVVSSAFNARPTAGMTTPAEDDLAYAAVRDAALAYTAAELEPQHHVTLTSAWVDALR